MKFVIIIYQIMYYLNKQQGRFLIKSSNNVMKTLVIELNPFKIYETDQSMDPILIQPFFSLLGIKQLKKKYFLIIGTEVFPVCTIDGSSIIQIKKIQWIPLCDRQEHNVYLEQNAQDIENINKLFENGKHYYSDKYDLNQTYILNRVREPSFEQRTYYQQFIYNKSLMDIDKCGILKKWCKYVIQGYVETFASMLPNEQKAIYYIFSRRSNLKAGTRFFSRGVDDEGNVANFTQTQQVIFFRSLILTQTQIRGSVPVFFEQIGVDGIDSQLNIQRSQQFTFKAFKQHFQSLRPIYKRIFCVNLLSIKKKQQEKLSDFFEKMINSTNLDYVRYQYFDFHQQCKMDKFENTQALINRIKQVVLSFNYNCYHKDLGKLIGEQSGVVRTNCLDCLDRTNYVQSRVGLLMARTMLECNSPPEMRELFQVEGVFQMNQDQKYSFIIKFNQLWADNGDAISNHYTGIGSTHTDITKTGRRTLLGSINHKLRSLMRFYTQFTDVKKHEAINNLVNPALRRSKTIQFSLQQYHECLFFSWSANEIIPDQFFPQYLISKIQPSFIVFFAYNDKENQWLESIKNMFTPKKEGLMYKWQQFIKVNLEKLHYVNVSQQKTQKSVMLVYSRHQFVPQISNIKTQKIKATKLDCILICKFTFHKTSLVFLGCNCSNLVNFYQLLDQSHNSAFQVAKLGKFTSTSISEQHYSVVLGNIGTKLMLPQKDIEVLKDKLSHYNKEEDIKAKTRVLVQALDNDQFTTTNISPENTSFYSKHYCQAPISFIPDGNRMLFWKHQNLIVKVLSYEKYENCIVGHFSFQIKTKH